MSSARGRGGTGGPECDPKRSMAFLQNQFRCPPYWELEEPEGPKGGMGDSVIGEAEGLKRKKALSVSLSIYFRNKAFVSREFLNASCAFKKQDVRFREFLDI